VLQNKGGALNFDSCSRVTMRLSVPNKIQSKSVTISESGHEIPIVWNEGLHFILCKISQTAP
jgi:hypothetical protein